MDQSVIVLAVIKDLSSKVSGGSEPLKKAIGAAKRQSTNFFLHARHRETNTKLRLRSSNAINSNKCNIYFQLIKKDNSPKNNANNAAILRHFHVGVISLQIIEFNSFYFLF